MNKSLVTALTTASLLLYCLVFQANTAEGKMKVLFSGNKTFAARLLEKQLPPLYGNSPALTESLKVITARLRLYYSRHGFLDVTVSPQISGDSLMVVIEEGPQYTVRSIDFSGNHTLADKLLDRCLVTKAGRGFDLSALGEDDFNLMLLYADFGFIYAEVSHEITYLDEHAIVLSFRIMEGERVRIGRINLAGQNRTKPETVLREMTLMPGQVFSRRALLQSQMRLMDSDLFKSVVISPGTIAPDSSLIDIDIEIEEKPPRLVSTGLGYGSGDAFRLTADWAHRNLSGLGRRLEFKTLGSFQVWSGFKLVRGRTQISYQEPWFWNTRTPLEITAYYDDFRPPYTDYRLQTVGIDFELFKQLGRFSNAGWRWRQEWLKLSPNWREKVEGADTLDYRGRRSVLFFGEYQRFDDPVNPKLGFGFNGEVQYTGGKLGGSETFQRFSGEARFHYKKLFSSFGLSGRLKLGIIGDWNLEFNAPPYEKYFLGGPFTVRGYGNGRFGEVDPAGNNVGGDKMGLVNLELKKYFPKHWVGAVFVDAALLENCTMRQLTMHKWKASPGFGTRYIFPFGTGRLDFAVPYNRREEIKYWKVVVAWGETF
jgi:outer membrane protein assembly complex protein YaeT